MTKRTVTSKLDEHYCLKALAEWKQIGVKQAKKKAKMFQVGCIEWKASTKNLR